MQNIELFSDRVENYMKYRPHYPPEIISFLKEQIAFNNSWIVADIGSGTGISTELFLQNGNTVYAVEPNKEMREAAETIFEEEAKFISVNGSAETTCLSEHSIDLLIAGQSFHWFAGTLSKQEFQRIARLGAYLVLMWNDRKIESNFQLAYENMLIEFAPGYKEVNYRNIDEAAISTFFSPQSFFVQSFYNSQFFDFESLKGRLLSVSYAPLENHAGHQPMMNKLAQIFDQWSINGRVEFEYKCSLYYGKIG